MFILLYSFLGQLRMRFGFIALGFVLARAATVTDPTTLYSSEDLVKIASSVSDTHSPLKDFTYLLTFSETVQAGSADCRKPCLAAVLSIAYA